MLIKTQERVDGKESEGTLNMVYRLADCLMKQGKREEALPYAQRAVDGYRQLLGTNDSQKLYIEILLEDAEKLLEYIQRKK